jgi:hypothetical protein
MDPTEGWSLTMCACLSLGALVALATPAVLVFLRATRP